MKKIGLKYRNKSPKKGRSLSCVTGKKDISESRKTLT